MSQDRIYCGSPECKNECGRKLPDSYYKDVWKDPGKLEGKLIYFEYFCGEPPNTHVVNTFDKPVEKSE